MHANVEFLSAVVRVWDDGKSYGDPYQWAMTVRWISRDEVEILGVTLPPSIGQFKAAMRELRLLGVASVVFTRFKNGVGSRHVRKTEIR